MLQQISYASFCWLVLCRIQCVTLHYNSSSLRTSSYQSALHCIRRIPLLQGISLPDPFTDSASLRFQFHQVRIVYG
ncbi:hypothetical protein BDR07DRAFT_1396571 [Suillus spraguei]|nr:hypothetical protein BDR07DRAFT_1396571 [Suillus spraguei]